MAHFSLAHLALAAAAATLAACQPGPLSRNPLIAKPKHHPAAVQIWDINGDGKVTCEDWNGYKRRLFAKVDINEDGQLDPVEYGSLQRRDKFFQAVGLGDLDGNSDKLLSGQEFEAWQNPVIRSLDKNGDCVLAGPELMGPPRLPKTGKPPGGSKPPGGGRPGGGTPGGGVPGGGRSPGGSVPGGSVPGAEFPSGA